MAYKFRTIEKLVGIFVILGLTILIIALIFVLKGQHLIVKKIYFTTYFNSAENLSISMPVKLKGIEIGRLTQLHLDDSNRIVAKFYILKDYHNKIRKNSVIMVNSPLIGEKFIEITTGSSNYPIAEENDIIYSTDTEIGRKYLSEQLGKMPASPTDLILKNVQLLTAQLSDPQGSLMQTLANFRKLSESLAENRNVIKDMMEQLRQTGENLKVVSEQLKNNPILKGQVFSTEKKEEKKPTQKR